MKQVTIPAQWLQELIALCGPEDHELRERVMKSAAPATADSLATATGLPAQAVEPLDIVQAAADAASVGHLSHLIDYQSQILARAMAAMKAVELTASPIDEPHGDLDARIPYEAWATFVDARAALLYDVKRSPVAAPQAQADVRDAEQEVLMEHSGCGSNTQVDMLTVRLNPGDKVVMHKGRMTQAFDRANRAAQAAAKEGSQA